MKVSYVIAFVMLALGALASTLLVNATRRAAPSPEPSVMGSLEHAVSDLSEPGGPQAIRPAPEAKVTAGSGDSTVGDADHRNAPGTSPVRSDRRGDSPTAPAAATGNAPAQGGMIVVLDPESGNYVAPTPQQVRALMGAASEATSKSDEGLVEKVGPNGAIGVDLQGRFQEYATISVGRDGTKRFGCAHGGAHSAACLDSLPAPKPLEEE